MLRRIGVGVESLFRGKGQLAVWAGYAGAFYRRGDNVGTPDIQSRFLIFSQRKMGGRFDPFSGFTASCYQSRPMTVTVLGSRSRSHFDWSGSGRSASTRRASPSSRIMPISFWVSSGLP